MTDSERFTGCGCGWTGDKEYRECEDHAAVRLERDELKARLEAVRACVDRTSPEELPGLAGAYARGCNDVRKDILGLID